jgi:hypothetical protein
VCAAATRQGRPRRKSAGKSSKKGLSGERDSQRVTAPAKVSSHSTGGGKGSGEMSAARAAPTQAVSAAVSSAAASAASPAKATKAAVEAGRTQQPKNEGARARRRRKAAQVSKKLTKATVAAMGVSATAALKGSNKTAVKQTREAKRAEAEPKVKKVEGTRGKGKKAALERQIYVSGALRAAEKAGYKSAGVLMYHISDDTRHTGRLSGVSLLVAMQVR